MTKTAATYNSSKILFLLLMAMIWIPLLQMQMSLFGERKLDGAIEVIEKTPLTQASWFDESFQAEAEKYLNQNFGFRNTMVRIYNQMAFWLYEKTTARNVVVGKENYLYEKNYINAYYGRDFIGDSLIRARVQRLKYLQDTLAASGKLLFVSIAPGKTQFYPDYIPNHLRGEKSITNYEKFLSIAEASGLNVLDFNAWFLQMKDTSRYPLYPKTGIHWSHYGMNLYFDSISKYIEKHKNVDIPDYLVSDYKLSTNYQTPDRDIEDGMNLLFPISNFPLAYGHDTVMTAGKTKLKAMVVSDSFFWGLYGKGLMYWVFNDGEFWFYNREIFQPSNTSYSLAANVDVHNEIMEKDVIMLLTTDANLRQFPWGFDETAWEVIIDYDPMASEKRQKEIESYVLYIKSQAEYMDMIREKALAKNISVDSMLKREAIYIYEKKHN